ncbi:hypothetical protein Purlil1_11522 [Purpureocillium lilacinum]|uniref:Uncharacterized protein n=1 Tax=Purpureocillium lilacinum TaxID=33203 RepID=A0ABR0BJI4_PURLI|nr:hypothetical protein Purlil1_11522 [Purpureocillium lilacinum]
MPCDGARAVSTNLSLFRSIYHHRSGYVNHRGLPQSPGLPPHLGRHVPLWRIESANMRIGELCPCALATASLLGERLKLIPQSANFKLRHWRPERQVGKTGGHDGQNRSTLSSSEASMAVRRCEQGGTNGASPYRGVRTAVVPCHIVRKGEPDDGVAAALTNAVRRTVVVRWRAAIPMCEAVEGVVLGGVSGDERGSQRGQARVGGIVYAVGTRRRPQQHNNINNLPLHSFKGHVNGTPDRHALLSCIAPSPSPGSFCGRTGLAALSLFVLVVAKMDSDIMDDSVFSLDEESDGFVPEMSWRWLAHRCLRRHPVRQLRAASDSGR